MSFSLLFSPSARLKTDNAGGAWCPQKQLDAGNSGSEWIQVDLGASHVITGVATQGRYGKGMGQEFTEAYRLLYSRANAPDRWILWRSSDNVSVSVLFLLLLLMFSLFFFGQSECVQFCSRLLFVSYLFHWRPSTAAAAICLHTLSV